MRDITGSNISVTQAPGGQGRRAAFRHCPNLPKRAIRTLPRIHTRLTICSSRVKAAGAKSLQSFHQGKIRTCFFSLGRDTATHENRALLRAHFLVYDSADEKNDSSGGKMIL